MLHWLKDHVPMLAALGIGIVIGASGIFLYQKFTRDVLLELSYVNNNLQEIKRDIAELRHKKIKRVVSSSSGDSNSVYFAAASQIGHSTSEEEEIFEEAYGGDEITFEPVSDIPAITVNGPKDSLSELYAEADILMESPLEEDRILAYNLLLERKNKLHALNNSHFLWRLAKATYQNAVIAGSKGDTERKKEMDFDARDFAFQALELSPNNADIHKWCAITLGNLSDYVTIQQKIQNGYEFKDHVMKAIESQPDDPTLHHLMGRWCYSVYMLPWLERKVASTLFATPPTSTIQEAKQYFLEAERLRNGGWKENMLYIAKCFIEESDYPNAITWLEKAADTPNLVPEDISAEEEIQNLLRKYRR